MNSSSPVSVPLVHRELLTIIQAADRAKVSKRTIYNWLHTGRIETERTFGGALRIYADSLWQKPKLVTP